MALQEIIQSQSKLVKSYAHKLGAAHKNGYDLAQELFKPYTEELATRVEDQLAQKKESGEWTALIDAANADLTAWKEESGRIQRYTPEELAQARLQKEVANEYSTEKSGELALVNQFHQAIISYAIQNLGVATELIKEGKSKRKFAIVELISRLAPSLNFPGSSSYLTGAFVPYAREARTVLGESTPTGSYVQPSVAVESAHNLILQFEVSYALAETSAAPRSDVPKSKRLPEVHICSVANGTNDPEAQAMQTQKHEIPTHFREEFDSAVRELMFKELVSMYQIELNVD
ncbi:hypothetical protein HN587_03440 [Candidatus Woesearchaeota archaeon]|nr:hypothetical protein [Candidatus Woesearchaeota archaeon]